MRKTIKRGINTMTNDIKVVKFGGSSLADATQFKKVADIILSDKLRRYVVPSAPGKRFKDDTKVTDMLYACYDLAESDNEGYAKVLKISRKDTTESLKNSASTFHSKMNSKRLKRISSTKQEETMPLQEGNI